MLEQDTPAWSDDARAWKRAYNKQYAEANRDRIKAQRAARYAQTRAQQLQKAAAYREANRETVRAKKRAYRLAHPERVSAQRAAVTLRRRGDVLRFYGGALPACACCGETTPGFLTIDHVGGGGNAHRRDLGHKRLYVWIQEHGYPDGFRVLCAQCNWAEGVYGCCPHQHPAAGNWTETPARWTRRFRDTLEIH